MVTGAAADGDSPQQNVPKNQQNGSHQVKFKEITILTCWSKDIYCAEESTVCGRRTFVVESNFDILYLTFFRSF